MRCLSVVSTILVICLLSCKRIDAQALIKEIEEASGSSGTGLSMDMLKIDDSDEIKVLSPSTGVFYRTRPRLNLST